MRDHTVREDGMGAMLGRFVKDSEVNSKLIQSLIDASNSSIVVLDENRTIVFANRAWRQFASNSGESIGNNSVGKRYPDLFSGVASASREDAAKIRNGIQRLIENGELEFRIRYRCTAFAQPFWFLMHAAPFSSLIDGGQRLFLISHYDVTAAKFASDELRKDEERLRRLMRTSNIVPWEANPDHTKLTYVGERACELLGYGAEDWNEQDFWATHIHPADRERVVAEYSNMARSGDRFTSEYRMIGENGGTGWIRDIVEVVREWSKPPVMHGVMTDITDRKQAEIALAEMSGRLINAQEDERKRIARELHDDINQRIALISIELEQLAQVSATDAAGLSPRLRGIQRKVGEISFDVHRMSYELHPSKLDHLGLVAALNSFCTDLSRSRGIIVDFIFNSVPDVLPREVTLCLFRVAQEGLQNAAKHSGANSVEVSLVGSTGTLELRVSDTGKGFVAAEKMTTGLGLTSINERVRHIGGTCKIDSSPGRGTILRISVPVKNEIAIS